MDNQEPQANYQPQPDQNQPYPAGYVPIPDENNIQTLGILSLIFSFFVSLAGLIIGIVGKSRSKKFKQATGQKPNGDGLLTAGIVISSISLGLSLLTIILVPLILFTVGVGTYNFTKNNVNQYGSNSYDGYVCEDEDGYKWTSLYHSPSECAEIDGSWYYDGI